MTYRYGASLPVVTPEGRTVSAQMGDWNNGDPTVHVDSYQMEAPLSELQSQGWKVPQLGAHGQEDSFEGDETEASIMNDAHGQLEKDSSFHTAYESAARRIVNRLLE